MPNREFKLKPSKQYIFLICIVFLLSLTIILCLPVGGALKLCGFFLTWIYGAYLLSNDGLLRGKQAITSIKYAGDGCWQISMTDKTLDAELLGDSTVTGMVSVLRFRIISQRWPIACVVFRDSLPLDRYRQLVVQLKTQ